MRRLSRDEGVAAVFVARMLVALLALAAISIDLGSLRQKRRELRNGADAAVLAIAENCALGTRSCDETTARSTAGLYAAANDFDNNAGVEDLQLDTTERTVRLATFAVDPNSGQRGVRVPLMSLLGWDRVNVVADAGAEWGFPRAGMGLPLVLSTCEFFNSGGFGPGNIVTLTFHQGTGGTQGQGPGGDDEEDPCVQGPAGSDAAGSFGWLDSIAGRCEAEVVVGQNAAANPGQGAGRPPRSCSADTIRDHIYLQDVPLPLYSEVTGVGNTTRYRIAGFGAFHVTAYRLGNGRDFREPGSFACPSGADEVCLQGYFTTDVISAGEPGGPDFGVVIVRLIE